MSRRRIQMEPPGELVDVGGYRLHVRRAGQGGPVVALDSGLGGNTCLWSTAIPELARHATVCAIDRAGYAWSDPAPPGRARKSETMVEEHRSALRELNIAAPYVLVGHSFGAINMLVWARHHPDEVAGLILVDPSHPEMWQRIDAVPDATAVARGYRLMSWLARAGLMRWIGPTIMRRAIGIAPGDLSAFEQRAFDAFSRRTQDYEAAVREAETGEANFAAATTASGELGDLPLMLLTADWWMTGRPKAMKEGMRELRQEMLTWSSRSAERVVEDCGHGNLPIRRPAALVDAVEWVLAASASRR